MAEKTIECLSCSGSVTKRFARVFGTNDDEVHACLNCASHEAVVRGAAAVPLEERTQSPTCGDCSGNLSPVRASSQSARSDGNPSLEDLEPLGRGDDGDDEKSALDDSQFAELLG